MLETLKAKVRLRDKEKARKTIPLTMADPTVGIPARRVNAMLGMAKTTTREGQARGETNEERPTREACTDGHPMEDDPTNRTPMPLNWAKDVDESYGVRPVVSVDMRPTEYIDKATIPPPVPYGPHDLSALYSGTQNPWSSLSHCHHRHHRSQPPRNTSTPPPNRPPGTAPTTSTSVFTHRIHHHPISTHSQTPCQSTLSKWSATHRGLPPRSPSYIPHP